MMKKIGVVGKGGRGGGPPLAALLKGRHYGSIV